MCQGLQIDEPCEEDVECDVHLYCGRATTQHMYVYMARRKPIVCESGVAKHFSKPNVFDSGGLFLIRGIVLIPETQNNFLVFCNI